MTDPHALATMVSIKELLAQTLFFLPGKIGQKVIAIEMHVKFLLTCLLRCADLLQNYVWHSRPRCSSASDTPLADDKSLTLECICADDATEELIL